MRLLRAQPLVRAVDVVDRELSLLTVGVVALWMFIPATGWTDLDAPSALGVSAVLGACLVLAAVELTGKTSARASARTLVLGAVVFVTVAQYVVTGEPQYAASMSLLVVIVASALIPVPAALMVLGLAVLISLGPVAEALLPFPRSSALGTVTLPVYLLLVGVGVMIVRVQLVRNARLVDLNNETRDQLEGDRRVAEAVQETLVAQERILHETVLNTLTAVARGGLRTDDESAASTAERLVQAASVLEALTDKPAAGADAPAEPDVVLATSVDLRRRDLPSSIAQHTRRLRDRGVDVSVTGDDMSALPPDVRDACATATREALANVERHANATRVVVTVQTVVSRRHGNSVRVTIADDGTGFDPEITAGRFGTTDAILGAMESVSGSAAVQAAPGEGTVVTLLWHARQPDEIDKHRVAVGRIALSELAIGALFVAVTASVAWAEFSHPSVTFLGVALAIAFAALVVLAAPEAPVSWGFIVVVSMVGPTVWVIDATDQGSLVDQWTLAAVAGLYLVTAVLSPPWGWVLLLASTSALFVEGIEYIVQMAVLVLVGAAGGRTLRRDSAAMVDAHDQATASKARLDGTRHAIARLRARYASLTDTGVVEFLDQLADGSLDVSDPQVRARAAHEEQYIRSLMRTAPEREGLPALAGLLARKARDTGADLQVDLMALEAADVRVPGSVADSLVAAVDSMDPHQPARLVAHQQADAVWLTLVASIPSTLQHAMESLPLPGELTDPTDPSDTTMMWETHLTRDRGDS